MQLVHDHQIPGIGVVKAVAEYQEKGGKPCRNPDTPQRNSRMFTHLCFLEKEKNQKRQ